MKRQKSSPIRYSTPCKQRTRIVEPHFLYEARERGVNKAGIAVRVMRVDSLTMDHSVRWGSRRNDVKQGRFLLGILEVHIGAGHDLEMRDRSHSWEVSAS